MAERQPAPTGSYRQTLRQLSTAQKSGRGAPGYTRWVNRRLGRYLAAWAFRSGLSPDQVTVLSGGFTVAGIAVIALARPSFGPLAALLLLVGFALDSADGQVARLRGGGSAAGEWLDHVSDCIKVSSLHLAVAISWFRYYGLGHQAYLLIPIGYAFVGSVWFFAVILSEQIRRYSQLKLAAAGARPAETAVPGAERAPALRSLIVLPADYGLLALSFVLLGLHRTFGVVYCLFLVANTLFLATKLPGWYLELRALEPAWVVAGPR